MTYIVRRVQALPHGPSDESHGAIDARPLSKPVAGSGADLILSEKVLGQLRCAVVSHKLRLDSTFGHEIADIDRGITQTRTVQIDERNVAVRDD